MQLKLYRLVMLTAPEKFVWIIIFLFFIFLQNPRWPPNNMLLSRASLICSKEAPDLGHMLIRFWCDSEITFFLVRLTFSDGTVFLYN